MVDQQNIALSEAITLFLATLPPEQRHENQIELNNFVRWYGGNRLVTGITAKDIGSYSDNISAFDTDPMKKLVPIKSFLSFAHRKKLTSTDKSLATSVRVSKAKQSGKKRRSRREPDEVNLTPEGYAALQTELEELKDKRPNIAEQLRHAAADKDFKENAPLDAAREHQGQIEARIRDLEQTLRMATIIDDKPKSTTTADIGCIVRLYDPDTDCRLSYTLVNPSEANPAQGKLSIASPVGKALLGKEAGVLIKVIAPVGTLQYKIEDIKG